LEPNDDRHCSTIPKEEATAVTPRTSRERRRWFELAAVLVLASIPAGCGEGGQVDVGSPKDVRAKLEGGGTPPAARTANQAKAIEAEEAAAKKNPKLY
jgi:hypothetical protein